MTANDKLSRLLRALSHPHRRCVLYYLREHERATLETLADCVAGWMEAGPGRAAGVATDHEAVRTQLHHSHLPMLADAGVLRYDAGDRQVRLCDLPTMVEVLISTALTFEDVDESGERLATPIEE